MPDNIPIELPFGTGEYGPVVPLRPAGECGYVADAAALLLDKFNEAINDPSLRNPYADVVQQLKQSNAPLGDAIQQFVDVDLGQFGGILNELPPGLQTELMDNAISALNEGMEFRVSLVYSTNGSVGLEIGSWYLHGSHRPEAPPVRTVTLICPSFHAPSS